jgi:hypothetical protein
MRIYFSEMVLDLGRFAAQFCRALSNQILPPSKQGKLHAQTHPDLQGEKLNTQIVKKF